MGSDLWNEEEYNKDHKIDPTQLDVECVAQAELFFKWSERSIKARARMEKLKMEYENACAKVEMDVRAKPDKFAKKLPKQTESSIKAYLLASPMLHEAKAKYLKARKVNMLLERAVQARLRSSRSPFPLFPPTAFPTEKSTPRPMSPARIAIIGTASPGLLSPRTVRSWPSPKAVVDWETTRVLKKTRRSTW